MWGEECWYDESLLKDNFRLAVVVVLVGKEVFEEEDDDVGDGSCVRLSLIRIVVGDE